MQITGTNLIAAPVQTVWNALNDPEILRRCIPGCDSVERTGPEDFKIVMTAAVGPLKARFNGKLRIADANPPTSCVLHFEGQGGAMGFGKGSSTVTLREVPQGTELTYTAEAQVGGKLAQVGSRLIDGVARKMSDDFFAAFRKQLEPAEAPVAEAAPAAAPVQAVAAGTPAPATPAAAAPTAPSAPAPAAVRADAPAGTAVMVPGWWLAPAALIGGIVAIAGASFIR